MAEHYCLLHWRVTVSPCGQILAETIDGSQWQIQEIDFQKYLDRNGLVNWQLNYANHEGEHLQQMGKMEMDEYFEQNERVIHLDAGLETN